MGRHAPGVDARRAGPRADAVRALMARATAQPGRAKLPDVFRSCLRVMVAAGVCLAALSACTGSPPSRPSAAPTSDSSRSPEKSGDRPNIVFVLTDDLSMNLLGHMPHVLAMQRAGTTMSRYYVVDSLCCPSRAAIFTGMYPHNNGVFTNHVVDGGYAAYNRNGNVQRSFPVALRDAGYRTALFGKYLNGYQPDDDPARGWDAWDVTGDGYREYGYTLNHNGLQVPHGDSTSDYLVDVLANRGVDFIRESAGTGKPFFLEVATFAPHAPYTPAPRYANAVPHVRYPRTAAFNRLPTDAPSWLRSRPPLPGRAQGRIDYDYRQRVRADLAVDDLIGRLRDELQAAGVADNTYVVFSSDNGYHMGEYRLAPGKQTAFDTDIHVPLIVTGPGVPANSTVDHLASNVDLAPTFETLGRAPVGNRVDGVSLGDLWHGRPPSGWQQAVLIEHHGPNRGRHDPDRQSFLDGNPPSYQAIRTATALYVRYDDGTQEYYDTTRDPDELSNIAARGVPPALSAALTNLQSCRGSTQCQAAARPG